MAYSPYDGIDKPLMAGNVPVPKNDQEAVALIQRSKAAMDHHAARHRGAHPAVLQQGAKERQAHVDNVALALHKYHEATPSVTSQNIIDAIHSDPSLKISHPKPAPKKA